jgi:hypothetical protein
MCIFFEGKAKPFDFYDGPESEMEEHFVIDVMSLGKPCSSKHANAKGSVILGGNFDFCTYIKDLTRTCKMMHCQQSEISSRKICQIFDFAECVR